MTVRRGTARSALGFWQSALLVMGSWCTVLAAGAIAPVLPQMRVLFAATPNVDLMIGFVATAPSLAVALFALPLGILGDRVGLRPVLLAGLLIYGVSGVIPAFALDTLPAIIGMRFLTGLGEAAVMTASTALIGLMATGAMRARLFAAQAVSANVLGIGVLLLSGIAGLLGWRTPFLVYAFALVIFIPVVLTIRPAEARYDRSDASVPSMAWPKGLTELLVGTCLLIAWSTMALYAVLLQTGFLLVERGAADSAAIGFGQAIAACGIAAGALAGGVLTKLSAKFRLTLAYAATALGFALIGIATSELATSLTGTVAGFGCGLVVPTLLSRLLSHTPPALLGRVTGIWVAASFLAQFASPPVFIILHTVAGSLSGAFLLFALATLLVALTVTFRRERFGTP